MLKITPADKKQYNRICRLTPMFVGTSCTFKIIFINTASSKLLSVRGIKFINQSVHILFEL